MLLLASVARAVPVRRVFEPSELVFENPGVAQFGMQFGLVRGESAYRVSAPLFAFDLGLTPNVELDLDGEFAYGGPDDGEFVFNRLHPTTCGPQSRSACSTSPTSTAPGRRASRSARRLPWRAATTARVWKA